MSLPDNTSALVPAGTAVVAERVSKCYRHRGKGRGAEVEESWALADVSFELGSGSAMAVIGPNGAGKSTLLRLLCRMTPPTSGRIRGRGRVASLLHPGAGFRWDLTGRENVRLFAATNGIPGELVDARMDAVAELVDAGGAFDAPLARSSGGMAARLAFAAAVELDPGIVVADEALTVGDLAFQQRCHERLLAAREAGTAILFASHDLNAVRRLCDRALWLDGGKVVEEGPAEDVVARYEQVAAAIAARRLLRRLPQDDGSAWGRVDAVQLRYGPNVLESVSVLEPARLVVTFRAATAGLRARCVVDVYARGVLAFRTVQTEEAVIEEVGPWRARVHIPPRMLAPTVYTVSAFVVLRRDGEERVCTAENALSFRVYASAAEESPGAGFPSQSPGVMGPHLQWRFRGGPDDELG